MPFTTELEVKEVGPGRWELLADLSYQGSTDLFTVPAGFRSDFASVPQLFLWLIPRAGRYTKAAVLHDFLSEEADAGRFNRCDADGIFRRTMRELGVSALRRWLMWMAVRWGVPARLHDCGFRLLVVAVVLLLLVLPAALSVGIAIFVLLLVFYVIELAIFLALVPTESEANRPTFIWWGT